MDDKNYCCIVITLSLDDDMLAGIDITTSYNYWEKQAFIKMNEKQLFPCVCYGTFLRNFDDWKQSTLMFEINDEMFNVLYPIKDKLPQPFYPGY